MILPNYVGLDGLAQVYGHLQQWEWTMQCGSFRVTIVPTFHRSSCATPTHGPGTVERQEPAGGLRLEPRTYNVYIDLWIYVECADPTSTTPASSGTVAELTTTP